MGRPYKHALNVYFECIHRFGYLFQRLGIQPPTPPTLPPMVKNSCVRGPAHLSRVPDFEYFFVVVKIDIGMILEHFPSIS
jgi:hypothetical protein